MAMVLQSLREVRRWLDDNDPGVPKSNTQSGWIEFIADTFHDHQQKTGLGLSEPDFLPPVVSGDKTEPLCYRHLLPHQVALDNIRSAFNVGAILRLVDATGFRSVLIGGRTPGHDHRQVIKTAMGAAGWVAVQRSENLQADLMTAKEAGYTVIGIETVSDACCYSEYPWSSRTVVVLGNEEYGLTAETSRVCDGFVRLPMHGRKNSINVATAFAVIAYHLVWLQARLSGS
jgi:tRNA G18 (ribose-2'-O)-methylase SpoU